MDKFYDTHALLIEKTKILNLDEYYNFMHQENIESQLEKFMTHICTVTHKKLMPTNELYYAYLIYGYNTLVLPKNPVNIINTAKKIIQSITQPIGEHKIYTLLFDFNITLSIHVANNPTCLCDQHIEKKIMKLDKLVNTFYNCSRIYQHAKKNNNNEQINTIINEQKKCIHDIHTIGGNKGIQHMNSIIKNKININNLDENISKQLTL